MPITAYSKEAGRELDLEQWLGLNAYSVATDPQLAALPDALRAKALADIECSGCTASGATLVRVARSRSTSKAVGQGHFRFGAAGGDNPHDPLCDFYDEGAERGNDYLANFSNDRTALTRSVRDLVCRGLRAGLFSQADMRQMRLWFLEERHRNAVRLDLTLDDLKWCGDMHAASMILWDVDQLPFRPEHGRLPAVDWERAGRREWARRNAHLYELIGAGVYFRGAEFKRAERLVTKFGGTTVLDPSALQEKYRATIRVAGFAAGHVFRIAGAKLPAMFGHHVSEWAPTAHSLLALSALLLYLNDWDAEQAGSLFSDLAALPSAADGLEGNLVGLNPFHDYLAWQIIAAARRVISGRTDVRAVNDQMESVRADLQASFVDWMGRQSSAATHPH